MMYIIVKEEEANMITGNYGYCSGIIPIKCPSGLYVFPLACVSDPEFNEIKQVLDKTIINIQDISSINDVTEQSNPITWDEITLSDNGKDLYLRIKKFSLFFTVFLLNGVYKMSSLYSNNTEKMITIRGESQNGVILQNWDFENRVEIRRPTISNFSNIRYESLTIRNALFYHADWVYLTGRKFELVNVKHEITIYSAGGYTYYLFCPGLEINITNCELIGGRNIYAGVYFLAGKVSIYGLNVSGIISKPVAIFGVESITMKNVSTLGGTTGIFFGGNKTRPIENFVVEDCMADGADEECLSFDTLGNNVAQNPCIAELSVTSAEIFDGKVKIYPTARRVTGTHPNEILEEYLFKGNESYLERFYVYFSQLSGTFAGNISKIIEVGEDEGGQYLIADISLDPAGLTLNNYKAVSIMGGWFNGIVRNNIIRNGQGTGLALYCSFFNNLVEGNTVENCPVNGSYLRKSTMLANQVWNGADGNIIRNNRFDDGFLMTSLYGNMKGYNNTYLNNTGALVYDNEVGLITDVA